MILVPVRTQAEVEEALRTGGGANQGTRIVSGRDVLGVYIDRGDGRAFVFCDPDMVERDAEYFAADDDQEAQTD